MKKRKRGKRGGLAGVVDAYNQKETAGQLGNTALKTVVDTVIGVPVGIAIGGVAGLWSLPFGLLLIGSGHYFKDQSGLLKISGAAAIAYGIAKNIEFNNAAKKAEINGLSGLEGASQGIKDRLKMVKDDLMAAYFLDRLFKKDDGGSTETTKMETIDPGNMGGIDLSELDLFDHFNQQEANSYQAEAEKALYRDQPHELPYPETPPIYASSPSTEASFNVFSEDDETDFSDF